MGRGRGKGKRLVISNHDDTGSGDEEKIPAQKRRGRPQKPLKEEEDFVKIEEEESDNSKSGISTKEAKNISPIENGKKRKRNAQAKEKPDSVKDENGTGKKSTDEELTKPNGFRHNGSRRKNKPRRAAEAGVECK